MLITYIVYWMISYLISNNITRLNYFNLRRVLVDLMVCYDEKRENVEFISNHMLKIPKCMSHLFI